MLENSYGNKDFKSLQPKSSYPINNSFNKKEDMSPAIEFNFKEYIDSVIGIKSYLFRDVKPNLKI